MKLLAALAAVLVWQMPTVTSKLWVDKAAQAGTVVNGKVTLIIPASHHAYAPDDKGETIKVAVTIPDKADYKLLKVMYPKGAAKQYPGLPETMSVYEGTVVIPVKILLNKKARGVLPIKVMVKTQICSNEDGTCYPPKTDELKAQVTIKQGTAKH